MKLYIILILFSQFFFFPLANSSAIKQMTVEEGLSNRRVFSSAKDEKGYLWFATKTSIDRFDGERFYFYSLSNSEKNRGVKADKNNRIYAFTESSLYAYNSNTDKFEIILNLSSRNDYFSNGDINSVFFDLDNMLFLSTSVGMLVYNGNSWKSLDEMKGIPVYAFVNIPNGQYLLGTSKGVFEYRNVKNSFFQVPSSKSFEQFQNLRIQTFTYDVKNEELWIGTFANGLYVTKMYEHAKPLQIHKNSAPLKSIVEVGDDEMWVGSDGEGVLIFDLNSKMIKKSLAQSDGQSEYIGANGIYYIMVDGHKVWISTYTAGVFLYNTNSVVKTIFRHEKFNSNSLINNHVNVVYEDSDGDLWFGTNNGLSVYARDKNTWKHYLSGGDDKLKKTVVLSICEDVNGGIWVGGYASKLYRINKRNNVVSDLNQFRGFQSEKKSYIYSIVKDIYGNMWFGGSLDKLTCFNPFSNKFKTYNIAGVFKILEYDTSIIYLATHRGLYSLDKETDKIELVDFKKFKGGDKLVSLPTVNGLLRDRTDKNVIWVGTDGFGLFKLDLKNKDVVVYNKMSGLSSDYIYGLLYDKEGRMWITTEYGLVVLDKDIEVINPFFEFDGLSDNTFNYLAYCKLRNGELLFGTPNGANLIDPQIIDRVSDSESNFNLRFNGFYLFYEKINAATYDSPLKTAIDDTERIDLNHTQHSFSIDFINLNTANQHRTLYSWKLEGFDNEWTQPSIEHKAVYTKLPSGKYVFMVKAISVDNNSVSEIRSFIIHKRPPLWASVWAYLVYSLFLIWFIFFLIRFWLNKIDSKFTHQKIQFFVSMAHEIRTPITLIKAPLNEMENENLTSDGRSALELARKNTDKLYGMVTQLLDFQKIEADAMRLCIEETYIFTFMENVVSNYIYLSRNKGIDLQTKFHVANDLAVWIDRNKVQIMLENLIANAIKYSDKGGVIKISVDYNNNILFIQVSDTGIGIPTNAQENLFKRFYRADNAASSVEVGTGIGLMLTKKLAKLHKGDITFISSENVGSTFQLELPASKVSFSTDEIVERPLNNIDIDAEYEEQNQHAMQILLVEDNTDLRIYLARTLRKKYRVVEANNGFDALELLENDIPDLILSDVLMPEMNGFELCKKVKSNISTCHIPFILLTSLSDREDVIKGLDLGADDYITKPFDLTILEGRIKTIFNNRALYRKKFIKKSVSLNETDLHNDMNKSFMMKVVNLVEQNITNEEFNIDELSYEMAMSRSVFFKKVKSLTGQNPKDFIRDIKMNKAADFLRDKKYSVSEIAYLIGFPNAKYFSTAFKKYYGMTPSMFVEKEKREERFLDTEIEEET